MEGYLSLTNDGSCVEVVNSCRTLTYVRGSGIGRLRALDCPGCCCEGIDAGYGTDPSDTGDEDRGTFTAAPWYDPAVPASVEFLGLHGTFTLAPIEVDSGVGSVIKKRLTFTGTLLSRCDAGRVYGDRWLRTQLEPHCSCGCGGVEGTVLTHCGTFPDSEQSVTFTNPRPDGTLGRRCCDGDTEPPVLGQAPTPAALVDTGVRVLPRLRYVANSYTTLDSGSDWPSCYGAAVTFSFDLEAELSYTAEIPVCVLGIDPVTGEPGPVFDNDCCDCHSLCFETPAEDECSRCGWPCSCTETVSFDSEYTHPVTYTPDSLSLCRWSQPLCSARETCITPALPHPAANPIIRIAAGASEVQVAVTIWKAHPGLPDPATCSGMNIYDGRHPMVPTIQVMVPAGTVLILDGRTGSTNLICDGESTGDHLVSTCDGSAIQMPTVRCGERMWIAVDADCYNPPGDAFQVEVAMVGQDPT